MRGRNGEGGGGGEKKTEVYKQHVCDCGHDYRAEPVFIRSSRNKNINTNNQNHATLANRFKGKGGYVFIVLVLWHIGSPRCRCGDGTSLACRAAPRRELGRATEKHSERGAAVRSPVLRHHAPEIGGRWTGLRGVLRVRANNALRQRGGGCVEMRGFQNLTFPHHEECECFRSLH